MFNVLGKWLWAVVLGIGTVLGLIQWGRVTERKENKIEELEETVETIRRVQNAPIVTDRDSAISKLRDDDLIR